MQETASHGVGSVGRVAGRAIRARTIGSYPRRHYRLQCFRRPLDGAGSVTLFDAAICSPRKPSGQAPSKGRWAKNDVGVNTAMSRDSGLMMEVATPVRITDNAPATHTPLRFILLCRPSDAARIAAA